MSYPLCLILEAIRCRRWRAVQDEELLKWLGWLQPCCFLWEAGECSWCIW